MPPGQPRYSVSVKVCALATNPTNNLDTEPPHMTEAPGKDLAVCASCLSVGTDRAQPFRTWNFPPAGHTVRGCRIRNWGNFQSVVNETLKQHVKKVGMVMH